MRRGSALLMALWIILTLSVIVLSFSFEAHLQGGINVYTQSKNRVKRLLDSGRIIGEVVLLDYENTVKTFDPAEIAEKLEKDRWYVEKRDLKSGRCVIGPIRLDEEDPDAGTVSIEITCASADDTSGININMLESGQDANAEDRWRVILTQCGVPTDEVPDEDGHPINLQAYIIACWQDYRDDDNAVTVIDEKTEHFRGAAGAEEEEYEEYYKDHEKDVAEEDRFGPANNTIGDLKQLSRLLCFRKFPAVLTGGPLLPLKEGEKPDKNTIIIRPGLVHLGVLSAEGDGRINVNKCTVKQLMTVPGIFDPDDLDEGIMDTELAEAIVKCRRIAPTRYDLPEDPAIKEWGYGVYSLDQSEDAWWSDMTQRVMDEFGLDIPSEAKEYLAATPKSAESTLFKMKISASLMNINYHAEGECYIKDKKIRYVSWKED